ncbi:hypothetical protein Pan216_47280 [Planctomycetes bacterium Pan216]|uniref:Uncharacterized protein n=1 Tax=Kolteria novifilia TaxID=2527975 RepID=A0A518BA82_9BACT|nr:hypothetical protein Pan216_47280 [Planctomycetes bacterium Pan216]
MASRREQLESLIQDSPDDTFLLYGLAMEYVKEGETEEGLARLKDVTEKDPDYQAAYFQIGQLLADEGEIDEAQDWLTRGVDAAKRTGNIHAAEEMQTFLDSL